MTAGSKLRHHFRGQGRLASWAVASLFLALPVGITLYEYITCSGGALLFLVVFFGYFLYGIGLTLFVFVLSLIGLARARKPYLRTPESTAQAPASVTLAIAAYNEESFIFACLESLFRQTIPPTEIILVNDGSNDGMLAVLTERFKLQPDFKSLSLLQNLEDSTVRGIYNSPVKPALRVIDQQRAGKAAGLNAALALAKGDIFITSDADCVLERRALEHITRRFDDPLLVAAGGLVSAADGLTADELLECETPMPKGWLPRLQWIEYAVGFVWRFGWSRLNTLLLLSGSFSAFRRDLLIQAGGFDPKSITEDYEVAYRLHALCRRTSRRYRIETIPDAVVFTMVPRTLPAFFHQRTRWFQGFVQTLLGYRRLLFDSRYGWLGLFMLPVKCFDAVLPFWSLFVYAEVAISLLNPDFSIPISLFLFLLLGGLRFFIELATAWTVLALHQMVLHPRVPKRQRPLLFLLAPINIWFQRLTWQFYSLRAISRIFRSERGW